jgi:hypothetical protein
MGIKEMMSLYEYLGHAAGGDLGKKVAFSAAKAGVKHGEKDISNPGYKGIVYTYPKEFLDLYFTVVV